ncbi:hypothetical protein JNUCC42_21480 [Brevibacterium sp. JNUCC-42]|nr:hypothetical protein JNUCC42_21480 [Brevibacterium sp. JNUCC-42]
MNREIDAKVAESLGCEREEKMIPSKSSFLDGIGLILATATASTEAIAITLTTAPIATRHYSPPLCFILYV